MNGEHEHVHTTPPPLEVASPHARSELQTPHIIVSPELEEQEPLFVVPDAPEKREAKNDQKVSFKDDFRPLPSRVSVWVVPPNNRCPLLTTGAPS